MNTMERNTNVSSVDPRPTEEGATTARHALTGMVADQTSAFGAAPPVTATGTATAQQAPTRNSVMPHSTDRLG